MSGLLQNTYEAKKKYYPFKWIQLNSNVKIE